MIRILVFFKFKGRFNIINFRENFLVKFNYLKSKEDFFDICIDLWKVYDVFFRVRDLGKSLWLLMKSFCKFNVRSCYGGCVVGFVLDEDYKVNGVKWLRVVDSLMFKEL